jgi:valyl-tRNA synthetase
VWWLNSEKKFHKGYISEFLEKGITLAEIEKGLQRVNAPAGADQPEYVIAKDRPNGDYLPETDTFDTWFSSGQWPLVTLKDDEFTTRFPTDMMGTLADILKFWISRMIMFSLYIKDEVPFKDVYLWSMVADAKGVKMSKSKGNVINPIELVDKHGADAFRAALLFGTAQGGKVNLSEQKVIGMRNFANKIWNIGRFLYLSSNEDLDRTSDETRHSGATSGSDASIRHPELARLDEASRSRDSGSINPTILLKDLKKEFTKEKKQYIKYMESYKLAQALELAYEFLWHRFADYYIEQLKQGLRDGNIEILSVMKEVFVENLKMLHPFMPFVTESIWRIFHEEKDSILQSHL